jgi:hypothetical protein
MGPVKVTSVDDFSTPDTHLEQIYLLLHKIGVDCKHAIYMLIKRSGSVFDCLQLFSLCLITFFLLYTTEQNNSIIYCSIFKNMIYNIP